MQTHEMFINHRKRTRQANARAMIDQALANTEAQRARSERQFNAILAAGMFVIFTAAFFV